MLGYFRLNQARLAESSGIDTPPTSEGVFNDGSFNTHEFNSGVSTSVSIDVPLASIDIAGVAGITVDTFFSVDVPLASIDIAGLTPHMPDVSVDVPLASINTAGLTPVLIKDSGHVIISARYFDDARKINHIYVIGKDRDDNYIYGEATDPTGISEWGVVRQIIADSAILTETDVESVADNILAKTRFQVSRGQIAVPPNCGMELHDVISLTDSVCNQSSDKYRVSGYTLEYYPNKATFLHTIQLTTP